MGKHNLGTMRYVGSIFGCFILLGILPFILQETENFERPPEIEETCDHSQTYTIGIRPYEVCFDTLQTERQKQLYKSYEKSNQ